MGRFRWVADRDRDDGDNDSENSPAGGHDDDLGRGDSDGLGASTEWEFVPSDDQEATALAVRRSLHHEDDRRRVSGELTRMFSRSRQPFIVLVPADAAAMSAFRGEHERGRSKRSRLRSLFWCASCVFVALFASWLQREGPPAPPPAGRDLPEGGQSTWNVYLSHHSSQLWESATALFYHTPSHLLKWWVVSLRLDFDDWTRLLKSKWTGIDAALTTTQCVLSVPTDLTKRLLLGSNNTARIVGQAVAVQSISDAFTSWSARISHDRSASGPLVLFLSGSPGTGKGTLAKAVARLVSNCTTSNNGSGASAPPSGPPVNVLSGDHYRSTVSSYEASSSTHVKLQLLHDLQNIVRTTRKISGDSKVPVSFVILENVEDIDPRALHWVLTELSTTDDEARTAPDVASSSPAVAPHKLREEFARTVLFLTSSTVGTKTIASWLRHSGLGPLGIDDEEHKSCDGGERLNDAVPEVAPQRLPPSFFLDMEHEVDAAIVGSTYRKMSAVIPFVPHTRQSLARLFRDQLQEHLKRNVPSFGGCEVTVRSSLVHEVLDRGVEFVSWRYRSSDDEDEGSAARSVLTFSSAGAAPVPFLVREFVARLVSWCPLEPCDERDETVAVLDTPSKEERGDGALFPSTFVLMWCRSLASAETCTSECSFQF
jgi:DNA polymerase III delta prime subunit